MGLKLTRETNETWRQCVERYAYEWGLQHETLRIFDAEVAKGREGKDAAWTALYEWDLLNFVP